MARLTGPDAADRLCYTLRPDNAIGTAAGLPAVVYADSGGTQLANILTTGGTAISGSTVTIDATSLLPLFQYPDSATTVYVSVNGGPVSPVRATIGSGGSDTTKYDKTGGQITGDVSVSGYTGLHGTTVTGDLQVTGYTSLQGLSLGGDLAVPNLHVTGSVTLDGGSAALTATPGTNTTQLATTAFVAAGLAGKISGPSSVSADSNGDMTGLRRLSRTLTSDPAVAGIERWDLNYTVTTSTSDLARIYVNGVEVCWRNEIGFLRGTPNTHYKDDALVRGITRSDLTTQTGGWLELQEPTRTYVTYKRDWFGRLWRGNGTANPSQMSDSLVLGPATAVPASTPANTVIVRTVS